MLRCDHKLKIDTFGLNDKMEYVAKQYSCTDCEKTFKKIPVQKDIPDSIHSNHKEYTEGCFACKSKTLQLATGDATSNIIRSGTTQKKWNKELDLYESAVRQGVQPENTRTAAIQKALDISDKAGKAFNASTDTILPAKKGK